MATELEREYPDMTVESREKAIAAGMEVIDGNDVCLLLDLDNPESVERYRKMIPYMKQFGANGKPEEWRSKSGAGLHVRIWLDKAAPIHERIAMQSILGSDPFRDFLCLRDVRDGNENPIMLFKPAAVVAEEKAAKDASDLLFVEIFGADAVPAIGTVRLIDGTSARTN